MSLVLACGLGSSNVCFMETPSILASRPHDIQMQVSGFRILPCSTNNTNQPHGSFMSEGSNVITSLAYEVEKML